MLRKVPSLKKNIYIDTFLTTVHKCVNVLRANESANNRNVLDCNSLKMLFHCPCLLASLKEIVNGGMSNMTHFEFVEILSECHVNHVKWLRSNSTGQSNNSVSDNNDRHRMKMSERPRCLLKFSLSW
jgi:hypothetical protein